MARGTARSYFWVLWEWVASLGTLLWISLVERLFFFTRAEEGCEQRYSADYRCRERQWKTHGDQIRLHSWVQKWYCGTSTRNLLRLWQGRSREGACWHFPSAVTAARERRFTRLLHGIYFL